MFQFRNAANHSEIQRIYENMSILQFLANPLIIVDPLNVAIEYLFKAGQTGIIYVGDPDFEEDLQEFSRGHKFRAIIVRHFAFDACVFQRTHEMVQLGRDGADKVRIFHVAESLGKAGRIAAHNVLRFDLHGADLNGYVFHNLKRTLYPSASDGGIPTAGGGGHGHTGTASSLGDSAAGDAHDKTRNRFEKVMMELDCYLTGKFSLSSSGESNHIRTSVDRLKKLKRGGAVEEALQSPHLKNLERASGVFSKFITVVDNCPFR